MATIDQLTQDLRAEGSVDSEGRFTLDREQARAKMQKFQLVDARRYVVELVQAAILRDATAITFAIDADDMRMRFDGDPFTADEVEDLYGSLFTDGDTRRLRGVRQLALALNAALGMDPKHILMRSGVVELRMAPGKRDEITIHDKARTVTEIHVRQRLRVRVFVDFFKNLFGWIGEEQYLRTRCVYSTVSIVLDGVQINKGLGSGPFAQTALPIEGTDFRGVLELAEHDRACELRLVKDGVWIDSKTVAACGTHLCAVIEGDNLRKDVSQAKIVENAALERITAALAAARWTMWKRALDRNRDTTLGTLIGKIVGEQLLEHSSSAELREHPDARALTSEVGWPDCRDPNHKVTLARLFELVAAEQAPRYSKRWFVDVPRTDPPILYIPTTEVAEQLGLLLDVELVADDLLERVQRRKRGEQAWLTREAKPVLPAQANCTLREPIMVGHPLGPICGEVGIDVSLIGDPSEQAPIHLFLSKDGRLLGREELELGLANVWMAIEAPFEPTDPYTSAVRDELFARALLHAFVALLRGLVELLLEDRADAGTLHSPVRGLAKQILILLVDPPSQAAALAKAGCTFEDDFFVLIADLLPGCEREVLLEARAEQSQLVSVPLFEDLGGGRRSLAQLAESIRATGKLRFVDSRKVEARLRDPEVLFLGPGDRKIVRALFGDDRLELWDPSVALRKLEFWGADGIDLGDELAEIEQAYVDRGVGSPRNWYAPLVEGPTRGFVQIQFTDPKAPVEPTRLETVEIEIRIGGRVVGKRELDAGFGPARAVIDHPDLRPNERLDGVVEDQALAEALAAVRATIPGLHRQACAGVELERDGARRWLARVVLHAAAVTPELREHSREAPLLTTVEGESLSLARAAELAVEHGTLEVADRSLGLAVVDDPPVLAIDAGELADLELLLGLRFGDGTGRVRLQRVQRLISGRPRLPEAKLGPHAWVTVAIEGPDRRGELGLARGRVDAGLHLTLGIAGRKVAELVEKIQHDLPIAAIVIDEALPVDNEGNVEVGHERVRELVRQCQRRVPALIEALCAGWSKSSREDRTSTWPLLVRHLRQEAKQTHGGDRARALAAAKAVPGFRDVRGRQLGLAQILTETGERPIDVLTGPEFADLRVDLPELDRVVLVADARELECLATYAETHTIDETWEQELATIRALDSAPKFEPPNIHSVAIAYRKAMVAGGLSVELWIPRHSVFESNAIGLQFIQANRVLASFRREDPLPCVGLLRGAKLRMNAGEVLLDERQIASLDRQRVILYADLAKRFSEDTIAKADHAHALEHLAWAAAQFAEWPALAKSYGKHGDGLCKALDRIVPPGLRAALATRLRANQTGSEVTTPEPVATPEPIPVADPLPSPVIATQPTVIPPLPDSPDRRLLAAIYEQLAWARARHLPLEQLLLHNVSIHVGRPGEIATVEKSALTLNRLHPLVARLRGQNPHDPVDLSFLLAALFSLLNYEAEAISDDHEREFVAQLAQSLALATRQRSPQPRSSSGG